MVGDAGLDRADSIPTGTHLQQFGHVAASTSGYATVENFGTDRLQLGIKLVVDSTVKPRFLESESGPVGNLKVRFSGARGEDDLQNPQELQTSIPLWMDGGRGPATGTSALNLVLPDGPLTRLYSLAEFAPTFWESDSASPESLKLPNRELILDTLAQVILTVTARLHEHSHTIGLLDPANVFFYEHKNAISPVNPGRSRTRRDSKSGASGKPDEKSEQPSFAPIQVLLPDLLLYADNSAADIPPWISSRDHYGFLWSDIGAAQSTGAKGETHKKYLIRQQDHLSQNADLQCLARLFAWALTGKKIHHIPEDIKLVGGCWDVFRRMLDDPSRPTEKTVIQTANQATVSLSVNRPSEHLRSPVAPPVRNWSLPQFLPRLLGAAIIGLLLFGGYSFAPEIREILFRRGPDPKRYSACPDCPPDSKLPGKLQADLDPLIKEFHAEGRFHYQQDGTPVLDFRQLTSDVLKDQADLLMRQIATIDRAAEQVRDSPANLAAPEKACLEAVTRDVIGRSGQLFDVVAKRTSLATDTKERIMDLLKILGALESLLDSADLPKLKAEMGVTEQHLQNDDPDTAQLWKVEQPEIIPYFRSAACLIDRARARSFLIDFVKIYQLYKKGP